MSSLQVQGVFGTEADGTESSFCALGVLVFKQMQWEMR